MKSSFRTIIPFILLIVAIFCGLAGCTKSKPEDSKAKAATFKSSLPSIKEAPAFTGVNLSGERFEASQLRGSVWIGYFFFTSCAGPCPAMNQQVSTLQTTMKDKKFKFVGISVDPETDAPPVLAAYAQCYNADTLRWFMLQMPYDSVKSVAVKGFLLAQGAMNNGPDDPNLHSTKFVLVDKAGIIRGYYDGLDTEAVKKLRAAVDELLKE
jgi:protein SCO1/2